MLVNALFSQKSLPTKMPLKIKSDNKNNYFLQDDFSPKEKENSSSACFGQNRDTNDTMNENLILYQCLVEDKTRKLASMPRERHRTRGPR